MISAPGTVFKNLKREKERDKRKEREESRKKGEKRAESKEGRAGVVERRESEKTN